MKNSSRLMAATAPLALMVAAMISAATVHAADTATPRPTPKIRIPTTPPQIENVQRIRTPQRVPEDETPEPDEEAVKVESAEATPTTQIRRRIGTPRIDSSAPADIENLRRIRTPVAVPAEETPPLRTRKRTPVMDDSTGSAEIEDTPRIRTRVPATIEQDIETEQAPPTRRRIGNPAPGGTTPVKVPRPDSIRSVDSAQADCLFRPNRNPPKKAQSASSESVNVLALVCRVNGKAALMSFIYDMPADNINSDPRSLASQNHEAGETSVIGYEIAPRQTDAAGKPVYQLLSVARGERSRRQADCIDAKSSFSPKTSEDYEGSVLEKWCSDGTSVFPVSFKINRWLERSREKGGVSISAQDPNDNRKYTGTQSVVYDDAFPADANGSLLFREATATVANVSGWDCNLLSRDPASLYCESDPVENKGADYSSTQTTFLAYSLPEVKNGIGPLGQNGCENVTGSPYYDSSFKNVAYAPGVTEATRYYDYKKASCTSFRVSYRLLPGTVAKEYRSRVGGTCRLAALAGVEKDMNVTETWSRKTRLVKENNMVMEQPLGESTGVSRKINKVKAPCL